LQGLNAPKKPFVILAASSDQSHATFHYDLSFGGQEDRSLALHPSVRLANSAAIHEAIRT